MHVRLPAFEVWIAAALLALGLVVMTSASIEVSVRNHGDALFYFWRQAAYAGLGAAAMLVLAHIPLAVQQRLAPVCGIAALALLALVLVPGMGYSANGSTRWLALGAVQFQPSEFAKPALVLWLAAYMAARAEMLRTSVQGTLAPLGMVALVVLLLVLEPDFGTACVIAATAIGMLFLGGGYLRALLAGMGAALLAMAGLAMAAPYRLLRMQSFLDPWADPFNSGYQLTQSLIAIGSGGFLGQGLGDGVQKHFYLPEVHTDFVFAVAVEELGLLGAVVIIVLFALFLLSAFRIARRAQDRQMDFGAAVAYGIGLWISLQAFTNIAVNLGSVPTKGLTLPLMSAGGSSLVATMAGLGLLWRVRREVAMPPDRRRRSAA